MLGNGISHGMYNPATVWSSDTSMFFDGVNDVATYNASSDQNITNHFSVSLWFKAAEIAQTIVTSSTNICFTMENPDNMRLYVNGQLASNLGQATPEWPTSDLPTLINIGAADENSFGEYFNGWIRDINVFTGGITAEQVLDIYNNAEPKDESSSPAITYNWTSNNQYQGLLEMRSPPLIVSNYATS